MHNILDSETLHTAELHIVEIYSAPKIEAEGIVAKVQEFRGLPSHEYVVPGGVCCDEGRVMTQ